MSNEANNMINGTNLCYPENITLLHFAMPKIVKNHKMFVKLNKYQCLLLTVSLDPTVPQM